MMDTLQAEQPPDTIQQLKNDLARILLATRDIDLSTLDATKVPEVQSVHDVLREYANLLRNADKLREANALDEVREKVGRGKSFGGLGLGAEDTPSPEQYIEIVFLTEAWMESVNSQDKSRSFLDVNYQAVNSSQPMTLAQKIFTQHALSMPTGRKQLSVGDVCRVGIDWVIASELSWSGMVDTYEELGSPGIWRNDRFWLAGDHVVHPSIVNSPKVKAFIESAEKAKRDFKMTDYQGE